MQEKYNIFISYRERDGLYFAENLKLKLQQQGYNSIYFNPEHKVMGEFPERLKKAIESCTDFIIVVSPYTVEGFIKNKFENDFVQQELFLAYSYKKNIIPVMIEGASWPNKEKLNVKIAKIHDKEAISFIMEYHDSAIQRIVDALKSLPEKEKSFDDDAKLMEPLSDDFSDEEKERIAELLKNEAENSTECLEAKNALLLGRAYENGEQVIENVERAKYYYHIGDYYELGEAKFLYARLMLNKFPNEIEVEEFVSSIKEMADAGHISACLYYGNLLFDGKFLEKSESKAIQYWKTAEKKGSPEAQYYMAWCYYFGIGVSKDYEIARMLSEKSNAQSFPRAARLIGIMYEDGNGYEKNIEEAIKYFKIAIKRGDKQAHVALGNLYYWDLNDYDNAFIHYSLAADSNLAGGMHHLAWAYYDGKGIKINYELAAKWFLSAIEGGYEKSKSMIKNAVFQIPIDDKRKRFDYAKQAVELGCYDLCAYMYFSYKGVTPYDGVVECDEQKALYYLELGWNNNDEYCRYKLPTYYSTVISHEKYRNHEKCLELCDIYFKDDKICDNTSKQNGWMYLEVCFYFALELLAENNICNEKIEKSMLYIKKSLGVSNRFFSGYISLIKGFSGLVDMGDVFQPNDTIALRICKVLSNFYGNQYIAADKKEDNNEETILEAPLMVYTNNMITLSQTCDEIVYYYMKNRGNDIDLIYEWMGISVNLLYKALNRYILFNAPGNVHTENYEVLDKFKGLISRYFDYMPPKHRLDWLSFNLCTLLQNRYKTNWQTDNIFDHIKIIYDVFIEKNYDDKIEDSIINYNKKIKPANTYQFITEDGFSHELLKTDHKFQEAQNGSNLPVDLEYNILFVPKVPIAMYGKYLIKITLNKTINVKSFSIGIFNYDPFVNTEFWDDDHTILLNEECKKVYTLEYDLKMCKTQDRIEHFLKPYKFFPYTKSLAITIKPSDLINENEDGILEICDVVVTKIE